MSVCDTRSSDEPELSFRQRILPAIQRFDNSEVLVGPRGSQHIDIRYNFPEEDGSPLKGDAGFYDPKTNKFHHKYTDKSRGIEGLNLDSQRLEPMKSLLPKTADDLGKPNWTVETNFKKVSIEKYYDMLKIERK